MKHLKTYESFNNFNFEYLIRNICISNNIDFEKVLNESYIIKSDFGGKTIKDSIHDGNIIVNRVISIDKNSVVDGSFLDNIDIDNFGIHWSWSSEGIPVWGRGEYTSENNPLYHINFSAVVSVDDINWLDTIKMNIDAPSEMEIVLNKGLYVKLNYYWLVNDYTSVKDKFSLDNFNKKIKIDKTVKI